jgi:hypothetical protein
MTLGSRLLANLATAVAVVSLVGSIGAHVGQAGEIANAVDGHRVNDVAGAPDSLARPRSLVDVITRTLTDPASPTWPAVAGVAQRVNLPGEEMPRIRKTMNLVYVGVLAVLLCALLDRYGTSAPIKAIAVLAAFASMPLARVPAYQPAHVDLGASVFIAFAFYVIIAGWRWAVIPATILAVLAREAGFLVVFFGLWRDWRRDVPLLRALATYAPAIIAGIVFLIWRGGVVEGVSTLALIDRPQLLHDPSFLLIGAYHLLTLVGGVSLVVLARALSGRLNLNGETEWPAYLAAVAAVSLVAGFGVWDVLGYAVPALLVLFAKSCASDRWPFVALQVGLGTLCTQQPWARMSDVDYLAALRPQLAISRNILATAASRVNWLVHAGLIAWLVRWFMSDGQRGRLIASGIGAAALLAMLSDLSGQITAGNAFGYDGEVYVQMLQNGYEAGNASTRLRPVVLAINGVADRWIYHDPVAAFRAMNLVYAFALAVILADLCRRYGASWEATTAFLVSVSLSISTAKMFAFYPTLVDLGAYAFMAASVWAIIDGRRLPIVVTTLLAVLSREFGAVNVLFGIVRDLRMKRSPAVIAATYAPAIAAFFALRRVMATYDSPRGGDEVLSVGRLSGSLLSNVTWWADPTYAMFWLYFALTVFGGLSLFLITTMRPWRTCIQREPEWLALIVPVIAVGALGYVDMWRYVAFVLPALPPLWAWAVSSIPRRQFLALLAAVSVATLITQRPWQAMDVDSYFRDWFPYYVVLENRAEAAHELWPAWTYHLTIAAIALMAIVLVQRVMPSLQSASRLR